MSPVITMKMKKVETVGRTTLFKSFAALCLLMLMVLLLLLLTQLHQNIAREQLKRNMKNIEKGVKLFISTRKEEKIWIAKRIHQMYKDENIPHVYIPYVKTWAENHPQWEYWFWTDLDARRLIIDHYPQYLDMYDSYSNNLLRSDAARYFILHHYGGVYADMDMDSYRPVDPLVFNYSCIFSQEPYIQSRLLYDRNSIAMNAWMACAANHKFMNFIIEQLPNYARPIKNIGETILITGPVMLQESLMKYVNKTRCSYGEDCHVYIAPPDMFMPTWDQGQKSTFLRKCRNVKKLSPKQTDACNTLKAVRFANRIPADVYGNHRFLHIGYKDGKFQDKEAQHISKIVKPIHRYSSFKQKCNC